MVGMLVLGGCAFRLTSRTTRIETFRTRGRNVSPNVFQTDFQNNKD